MNNVAEIEIGIDHKGRADMFGTDPETESDSHPEKKTFRVRSWFKGSRRNKFRISGVEASVWQSAQAHQAISARAIR
jgi:hypothetical protein